MGGFFVLLGLGFIPAINTLRLPMMLAEIDVPIGGHIYNGILDFTFMFSLDMIMIGAFMRYAPRQPARYVSIVWLVVALENVRGRFDDIYMIFGRYAAPFYVGYIIVHLIIITTGILFTRKVNAFSKEGDK